MNNTKALLAEFIGTFWLVLGGCGAAVIAGEGNHLVGIALAFGLCITSMAYAVGPISGGHFNPAISIGLFVAGRFEGAKLIPYIVVQVAGAICGAALLSVIAGGVDGYDAAKNTFAANGFGEQSPGHYNMMSAFITEVITTFIFATVIIGVTDKRSNPALGGLIIGLTLAGIIMASGPIANASLNPARSTGPALFAGGAYLSQLWLFWVAPIIGAAIAGGVYRALLKDPA